jgi:hypothetical protein
VNVNQRPQRVGGTLSSLARNVRAALFVALSGCAGLAGGAEVTPVVPPVLFNTAFESASLGRIEKLSETEFRLHLRGQQDARGRNRQATWFAVRLDQIAGRELTLRLTAFKGEYNDRPANAPAGAWYRPVYSYDGETWEHFVDAAWDVEKDELTLALKPRPGADTVWLAHVPPYSHARVLSLLEELGRQAHVRTEVIGQSVLGRPLHLVTVTNFARPDTAKKIVWMRRASTRGRPARPSCSKARCVSWRRTIPRRGPCAMTPFSFSSR